MCTLTRDRYPSPRELADAIEVLLASDYEKLEQAHRELHQTQVFYHALVEAIPQMMICKDLEGRFTFANSRFLAGLGTNTKSSSSRRAGWSSQSSSPAWASPSPAWPTRSTTRWRSCRTT